jgi:hypothetical protein
MVTGSYKCESIYCNSCVVIGFYYLIPIVCVEMVGDPNVCISAMTNSVDLLPWLFQSSLYPFSISIFYIGSFS